jgi:type IV secretion system protein VirB9
MDRTKVVVVLSLVVVGGCSLSRPIPPLKLANEATLPTEPAPPAPVDPLTLEPTSIQAAVQSYQRSGEAPVISGERTLYPFELTRKTPALVCAPLHVTDLTLGRSETVTDVATGDSERWLIEVAGGGNPQEPVPHVLIKPKDAPLRTNLVIMTTQHTYRLNLVARRGDDFTQAAGFYFPKELLAASAAAKKEAGDPKPSAPRSLIADLGSRELNLNYQVSGPDVPFRPLRAFDDGTHTYLQMPAGMKANEAPALLVATPSGDNALVNYRIAGSYYVIDRLFDQAVLLAGVGNSRDRVSITYTGGPRGGGEGA